MRKHLQGIDHVVIAVRDIAPSAAGFRRLGFTLTPQGRHTTGSENHCVMFERDYFELLSVPVPHPVTAYYRDFLDRGEGLAALALATDDARGFHDELVADGIAADPPVDFSRPVQLAHGTFDAAFRITQLGAEAAPAGRVFACQHFTRELVWRPEYLQHPNRVVALAGVVAVAGAGQLDALAGRYAAVFGVTPQRGAIGGAPRLDVATGNTPLTFTTATGVSLLLPGVEAPVRPQPGFVALYFRSSNLAAVREVLRANGVPGIALAQGIAVSPRHAHGVALVFTE
jgi:hypothetical protein